jgi:hypothetical protein
MFSKTPKYSAKFNFKKTTIDTTKLIISTKIEGKVNAWKREI